MFKRKMIDFIVVKVYFPVNLKKIKKYSVYPKTKNNNYQFKNQFESKNKVNFLKKYIVLV